MTFIGLSESTRKVDYKRPFRGTCFTSTQLAHDEFSLNKLLSSLSLWISRVWDGLKFVTPSINLADGKAVVIISITTEFAVKPYQIKHSIISISPTRLDVRGSTVAELDALCIFSCSLHKMGYVLVQIVMTLWPIFCLGIAVYVLVSPVIPLWLLNLNHLADMNLSHFWMHRGQHNSGRFYVSGLYRVYCRQ